jgi:malate dehydrogenase (oxaloacetate-decarboxylating)(NADP+)
MAQTAEIRAVGGLRGEALLNDPARNKGTAFTAEERREFGLDGLLPRCGRSRAVAWAGHAASRREANRSRTVHLSDWLAARNETLFYRTLCPIPPGLCQSFMIRRC